ncbi:MAG: VWA domain-containing protein [Gammaproteobacteria bacterium]|nr:MAG: VWA domain-containing protein [Gammaproteobacteria bacterium]
MLIGFFETMRKTGVPVSMRELLDLLAAMEKRLAFANKEEFYYLSRACMVKDERHFDRFDIAFARYFEGIETFDDLLEHLIPDEWLRDAFMKQLSEADKAMVEKLGGLEQLMEEFRKRLQEQKERHEGGNKWIGTGGTSPFGQHGYNPEGIRVGPNGGQGKGVKVWDQREYRDLDDSRELGTRNIKVALRRLRKFARSGSAMELDMPDTVKSTADQGGLLDIRLRPERHNAVKVLVFFDVGGSMDAHVRVCEELFSAVKTEFKHLEYFYFHNFLYDYVWRNNYRRQSEHIRTWDILHKYTQDYKVFFVGDASMSPYEIVQAGGSVEYWNDEPGVVWIRRMMDAFPKLAWLNPVTESRWEQTQSIGIVRELVDNKMFPLTLAGLGDAISFLSK